MNSIEAKDTLLKKITENSIRDILFRKKCVLCFRNQNPIAASHIIPNSILKLFGDKYYDYNKDGVRDREKFTRNLLCRLKDGQTNQDYDDCEKLKFEKNETILLKVIQ